MNQFLAGTFPITVEPTQSLTTEIERGRLLSSPAWGRVFTDHMLTMRFSKERGWHEGKIEKLKPFQLPPATMAIHYGLQVFEGLKVYRQPDGGASLFRPEANARRLNRSASRLAMQGLPDGVFVASVEAFASYERDWISAVPGAALYLRPFIIGVDDALGIRAGEQFLYSIIASPVNSYFEGDSPAVSVWISENYSRAANGGTGSAKCGGNYAAGLLALAEGRAHNCDQVVFLDASERKWIEEFGAMNAFFVFDDGSLVTPPLNGNILAGVTRDSLITLSRDMGLEVHERPYSIDEWEADAKSGRLRETLACGTAAVVTAIGRVKGEHREFAIGDGLTGPITARLRRSLTDIQYGFAPDNHGWQHRIY
jgi:branched-chain amino acid aminotransferase